MMHNKSGKFECIFTAVNIKPSSSIMLKGLEGSILGIWAAHGEEDFPFPKPKSITKYQRNTFMKSIHQTQMAQILMLLC